MRGSKTQFNTNSLCRSSARIVDQHKTSSYWPLAITALIIYGSCIPFQFNLAAYQASDGWGLFSISFRKFDLNDLITNIAVYIPFGFLWMRYWYLRSGFSLARLFGVGVAGIALSVLVESLQAGIALRYASWCDVFFNGFGSVTGAILFFTLHILYQSKQYTLKQQWATRPWYVAAFVLTLGIFAYELVPFDFITSSETLHSAFHRAQWLPLITGDLLTHTSFAAGLTDRLTGTAWFALLGFLLAASHNDSEHPSIGAIGYALFHGIILVSVIECMQLFTRSHVFELEAILFRSLAVAVGSWCAKYWVDAGVRRRLWAIHRHAGMVYFLSALVIFQMLLLIASAAPMDQWSTLSLSRGNFHWIPFESLWHETFSFAIANALAVIMTYATLSFTILMIMPRANRQQTIWIVCAFIFTVSLFVETAQWLTGSGTPDITTPLIAIASSMIASRAYFTLQSLHANAPN